MGGKQKVANRIKNNARPSSSGRSAAILHSSLPQYAGFSGIKESTGFPSNLGSLDEFDSSIDSSFQLVLKKISKKDPTTKLKGLQEFADLVKSAELDVVKGVLPVWPRFYNVLATDSDNRVREATHQAHREIVVKVKRNVAPYLKQLIPPWFTSQYDNYPAAASAAAQAFKEIFPKDKYEEAIAFCQEDILSYINENLFNQTVQTMGSKQMSAQDTEAKYERVLISCLQGYALYLEKVPSDKIQDVAELNSQIVSNSKFWKLSKNKIPLVRSAWYQVLSAVCQKAMFLLDGKETQVLSTVFNCLDDDEPTVLPYVWECVLLTVSKIPEWWKYVNVEKLFLPKLMKVLKQAGLGNALVIFPHLLPLISHLPPVIHENSVQFYSNFFENMRASFKAKSVTSSRSESSAIATSFVECLQYIIITNSLDVHLCKSLIKYQLLALIESCLIGTITFYKTIFTQSSIFVQYLNRSQSEPLQAYLNFFFENLQELFITLLNKFQIEDPAAVESISEKEIELVQSLKQIHKLRKSGKVTFVEENDQKTQQKESVVLSLKHSEEYLSILDQFVLNICKDYVQFTEENMSSVIIEKLCSLIVDFNQKGFFDSLLKKLKEKDSNAKFVDIYKNLLKKWLDSEKLFGKSVVDLIFLLLLYVDDAEQEIILEDILKCTYPRCLEWSVAKALSFPYVENSKVQAWLKKEKIGEFFITIAEKHIANEVSPELGVIFKLALTERGNGELIITKEVLNKIIEMLASNLVASEANSNILVDPSSSLAAYLCSIVYTENLGLTYGDKLLLCLFEISLKMTENEFMSKETLCEIDSAWQDTISILWNTVENEKMLRLTQKFADIIENEFWSCLTSTKKEVDHIVKAVVNYLRTSYHSVPFKLSELTKIFFDGGWKDIGISTDNLCKISEYVHGSLGSSKEITPIENIDEQDILQHFMRSFITFSVLSSDLVSKGDAFHDEDENSDQSEKRNKILTVTNEPEEEFLEALYNYTVGESFLLNFSNVKFYNEILLYNTLLEEKIKQSITNLDELTLTQVKLKLKNKCLNQGWFWCKAAYNLYVKFFNNSDLLNIYNELTNDISEKKLIGVLHIRQIFKNETEEYLNHLQGEKWSEKTQELFNKMEELRTQYMSQFLYDDVGHITWDRGEEIIEAVRLCSILIKHAVLTQKYWDFIVLNLVSWTSNCYKARSLLKNLQYHCMLVSTAELYINTCNRIKQLKEDDDSKTFVNEWEDVLVESIHGDLAQIWLYLSDQLSQNTTNQLYILPLIQLYGKITEFIRSDLLIKDNDNFPKWTKFLKKSCALLTSSQPIFQLWGYRMLLVLIPGFIEIDSQSIKNNAPHKKGLIFEQFNDKLLEVQEVVNSMLLEFRMGEDSCKVEPSYDSFTYTFAYLLLWDILLSLCEQSGTELRYHYAEWLKGSNIFQNFLQNLLKLLPDTVLHYSEGVSKSIHNQFLKKPLDHTCYTKYCDSDVIENMACYLYKSCLTHLPALVRQWWTDLDARVSQVVDKITTLYVSPQLCIEELNDVMQYQNKFKNMTIKVMQSIREILAVYTLDEAQMELTITLPSNYPLGSPDVNCNRQISGTTHKQWLLQFKKCVLHQNGRIWDGLSLWNNNLERKFSGVEECYICYAVLHPGTYQLPRLSCQTCKKKFHSACLYKWFSTSNKSSCPICRNLF